jgi:hypothetical protein
MIDYPEVMRALNDDLKLAWFEDLVQSQQPATQPWQPVTDYSFEARGTAEGEQS